jgi:hypothetical protein
MKNWFEMVSSWLSSWNHGDGPVDTKTVAEPEHVRRLREMQERGRTLFLP